MARVPVLVVLATLVTACDTGDSASRLDGAAFQIDFTRSTLTEPAAAASLTELLLADLILVAQFSDDGTSASAVAAVATAAADVYTQDPCSRTVAFPSGVTWTDPDLTIAATDWSFEFNDLSLPMRTLEMSATMSDAGDELTDFALTAYVDASDMDVADDADPPCDLASAFGIVCHACDGEPERLECLTVVMESGTASKVSLAADLTTVTAAEVSANADCVTE